MDGGIRICYDDGSHLAYGDAGRYEGTPDELANETDIQSIADNYDEIHAGDPFKWTEAILHPGAHIVGAFIDRGIIDNRETVERFLARCAELRLPILEVRGMVFGDESGV
ncbi:hypothetical protein KJ764_04200 [Patescibacteria group bacterium]|nr:hypothetical protein [Patescibacteria group bacterium]